MKPTTTIKKTIGVSMSNESKILKAIQDCGSRAATWVVAMHLRTKTPRILKMCKALEKDGKIRRSEYHSTTNNYIWEKV